MVDIHWRNTQKPVRFFFLDARAFVGILFYLVHARVWTLCLVFLTIFVFWVFERQGLTFASALRATRAWIVGNRRPGTSRFFRRRWTDSGCA